MKIYWQKNITLGGWAKEELEREELAFVWQREVANEYRM